VLLLFALLLYCLGLVRVILFCKSAHFPFGTFVGGVAVVVNVLGILLGGYSRGLMAPVVVVLGILATKTAFARADAIRDSDEEKSASRAAMALLALTLAEAFVVVVTGFVWVLASGI
jgi:hypothetical protein